MKRDMIMLLSNVVLLQPYFATVFTIFPPSIPGGLPVALCEKFAWFWLA
jgi:hypothetical protein